MISNIYLISLLISLSNLVFLSQKKDKSVDRYYWTILILIPIIILGYWLKSKANSPEAVMLAYCFNSIDCTIVLSIAFFSILKSINIHTSLWIKTAVYGITLYHLITIWLSKDNQMYFSSIELVKGKYGTKIVTTSGPLVTTHYIYLAVIFFAIVFALIYGLVSKKTYSKKKLWFYSAFAALIIINHILEHIFDTYFSFLPVIYCAGSLILTISFDNFQSHDIKAIIGEKQSKTGLRGFASFDKKKRLLGFNRQFAEVFPDIEKITIDSKLKGKYQHLAEFIYPLLDKGIEQGDYTDTITIEDKIYDMSVSAFYSDDESKITGYILELSDITKEKKKDELLKQYNKRINDAVKEKTINILGIQNAVVLGLANLVENRDNNTGGHVKRTSDIIKMLVDESVSQGLYKIDYEKGADIVRAAPMHDLGKMYIESSILCKPAKLTTEEYDIMKTHAAKSAEMIKIIMDGVEEAHFVQTAYNIARYHHERWDGKGYPEGLMGEEIPLEARIMAVADVYDALVSQRCYKEAMSFEMAYKIMNENMGSQFDPAMRPVFNSCREKLEEYYTKQ